MFLVKLLAVAAILARYSHATPTPPTAIDSLHYHEMDYLPAVWMIWTDEVDENDEDVEDIATNANGGELDQLIAFVGTSRKLAAMLQRGRHLFALLPRMLVIVARTVVEKIPTPGDILNIGKQTLIGMPQELIAYAFDQFCASAVTDAAVAPHSAPDPQAVHFVLMPLDGAAEVHVPLNGAERLWRHRLFRRDWPVVVVITGWNSNVNDTNDALDVLHEAYRCRGGYNFVAVDMAQFVDTLYTWSAMTTRPLGRLVGEALVSLMEHVPAERVHVIGHSLGAHISGQAGRTFRELTNRTLPRITGLDPARPCFNEGERLSGLQRDDAAFVDVIHTNAGILGQKLALGDVDFYPNGRQPLQPGCWTIFCAHGRAYEYFAETVRPGQERNFLATRCNKLSAYKRGRCLGPTVPMGLLAGGGGCDGGHAGGRPSGIYFLQTNDNKPFGRSSLASNVAQCNVPPDGSDNRV